MNHKLDAEARSSRASSPEPSSATLKLENLDFCCQRATLESELKMSIQSDPVVGGLDTKLNWRPQDQNNLPAEPIGRVGVIQQQPPTSQTAPKIYPNNTLVEDLSKCHENLQPKLVQATRRVLKLLGSCWLQPKSKFATKRTNQRVSSTNEIDTSDQNVKRHYEFTMPHSIVRLNSTLTPDDYNRALCILTRDMRYKLHLLLFSRLQLVWTLIGTLICVLVSLLTFTTATTLMMTVVWLVSQAAGFVACKRTRKLLDRMLERSVAQANTFFMDHKLMLGVINIGGFLTQSRFVVPVLYFDAVQCIEQIDSNIGRDLVVMRNVDRSQGQDQEQNESQLSSLETNQRVLARSQRAKRIVLEFSQRWVSHFDRSKLLLSDDNSKPRHLSTGKCLCQFIEETLECEDELNRKSSRGDQVDKLPAGSLETLRQSIELPGEENETKIDFWNEEMDSKRDPPQSGSEQAGKASPTRALLAGDYSELNAIDLMEVSKRLESRTANNLLETDDNDSEAPSKLVDRVASLLKQERAESRSSFGSELSFDLLANDQPQDRSESLIKSLRLLFELRANELSQNPDGKSAVALVNWGKISPSNMILVEQERDRHTVNLEIGDISDGQAEKQTSPGKKFFARFDCLFSMRLKKSRQKGLYASSSRQMLDIS